MVIFTSVPFAPSLKTIAHENKRWFCLSDVMHILRKTRNGSWERNNLTKYIVTLDYVAASGRVSSAKFVDTFGLNMLLEHEDNSYINKWFTETVFPTLAKLPTKTVKASEPPVNPFAEKRAAADIKSTIYKFDMRRHNSLGCVRVVKINGVIWLACIDVCRILKIKSMKAAAFKLPHESRCQINLGRTASNTTMITDSAALILIAESKAANAKAFREWLAGTVIPDIAKEDDSEFLFPTDAIKKKLTREEKIEAANKKADKMNASSNSDINFYIGELAKRLRNSGSDIEHRQLFGILRNDGYLSNDKNHWNTPTKTSLDEGLMAVIATPYIDWRGATHINKGTRLTDKGMTYFLSKYGNSTTTIRIKEAA